METSAQIDKRFESLIHELNLNVSQFAKSVGKPRSSIQIIIEGKSKPGFELLESILETYPKLNSEWLMTGSGEMFKDLAKPSNFGSEVTEKIEEHFRKIEEFYHEQLRAKDQQIDRLWSLLGKPKGCPSVANLYQLRILKKKKSLQKGSIFLNQGYKFGYTPAYL